MFFLRRKGVEIERFEKKVNGKFPVNLAKRREEEFLLKREGISG